MVEGDPVQMQVGGQTAPIDLITTTITTTMITTLIATTTAIDITTNITIITNVTTATRVTSGYGSWQPSCAELFLVQNPATEQSP